MSDYGNGLDCSVELMFPNPSSTALSLEVYVNDFLLEAADSVTFSTEWGDATFSGSETPMIIGQYYYCEYNIHPDIAPDTEISARYLLCEHS